jgi:hypothetical protein
VSRAFSPRVDRKFIGKYRPKIDGREKASGKAVYADDLSIKSRFPGLLYAKVLRSPHAHARIKSLDASAARDLPGVVGLLTCHDPDLASMKPANAGWTDGVDTVSYRKMMWGAFRDRRVLGDYACWVGDEVGVAVAAESELIAEEALRLVKVEWEVLPFVLDPYEAMKPGAPLVHPEISKRQRLPRRSLRRRGDLRGQGPGRRGLRGRGRDRRVPLRVPQRYAELAGQLVLRRRLARRGAHGLVQFLRGGPDAHAREPDARPSPAPGPRDQPLRRRPVRPGRHGRPALLPLHRPPVQARREGPSSSSTPAARASTTPGSRPSISARSARRRTGPSPPCISSRSATPAPTPTIRCSRSSTLPRRSPRSPSPTCPTSASSPGASTPTSSPPA